MMLQKHAAFSDPVFDSQRTFRAIMDAMARPATIQNVDLEISPPDGLPIAAAAAILTLCDFETALWVCPEIAEAENIANYATFHTGTARAKSPDQTQFALVDVASKTLRLADFAQGTAQYPDRSTTIIVIVPSLIGGAKRSLVGPGIQTSAQLFVEGLPDDFGAQWAANHANFPLGIDLIFCCGSSLVALPRSTRMMEI